MREPALTQFDSVHLAKHVSQRGWVALRGAGDTGELSAELLSIASALGQPMLGRGGLVESLKPIATSKAPRRSLSALHGTGAFPPHTDGAHLLHPPRFILLACVEPGCAAIPTTLFRFMELGLNEQEQAECERSAFLYRNGPRSFYSSIMDRTRPFIRFDLGCMLPTDADSEVALTKVSKLIQAIEPVRFEWQRGAILVIDNWHVLHGRGDQTDRIESKRHLLRVSVQ